MCDSFGDDNPELVYTRRRDLHALTRMSAKRDSKTPTTRDIALLLGPAIVQSLIGSTSLTNLRNTWESLIAAAGSAYNGLTVFRLQQILNTFPDLDPSTFLDWTLCAGSDASSSLGDLRAAQTSLCVCQLGRAQARRDVLGSSDPTDDVATTTDADPERLNLWQDPANITAEDLHTLSRRIFTQNTNPDHVPVPGQQGSQAPGIARALSAINQNQLRFEYFNFFRYASGGAGNQIGLEVTYLAGTDIQNLRADVRHLRDPNHSTGSAYDRFVILHYHFRSVTVNGVRMLGISQVNIRHGNQIRLAIRGGQRNDYNAGYVGFPQAVLPLSDWSAPENTCTHQDWTNTFPPSIVPRPGTPTRSSSGRPSLRRQHGLVPCQRSPDAAQQQPIREPGHDGHDDKRRSADLRRAGGPGRLPSGRRRLGKRQLAGQHPPQRLLVRQPGELV